MDNAQILNQFGPLPPDLADVQRYAAWKAADIGKALREGRQPTPGPPVPAGGDAADGLPTAPVGGALPPWRFIQDYGYGLGLSNCPVLKFSVNLSFF